MVETITQLYNKYNIKKIQIWNNASGKINIGADCVLHGYDKIYNVILTPYRDKKIKLCEIGVLQGHALFIYSKYFKNIELYGYDINIDFVKQFQTDEDFFKKLVELKLINSTITEETDTIKHKFDIIIDDGDHKVASMIKTLKNFYPKMNENGMYIIEDVKLYRYNKIKKFLNKHSIKHEYYQCGTGNMAGGLVIIKVSEQSKLHVW